jgi:hypothetical protein
VSLHDPVIITCAITVAEARALLGIPARPAEQLPA